VLRYDVETQTIISRYEGQTQTIQAINFNLFHNLILAGGSEKVIMVYDTRTRNPVNALMAHGQDITSLSFSLDS
jgi:WD40 repeat protein